MTLTPRRNRPVKKPTVVNWAQVHNQRPAGLLYRGSLMHAAFQGKGAGWADRPAPVPAFGADPQRGAPEVIFDQWAETCPVQWELCSYVLIWFFTNLLECPRNDHSGWTVVTNQDSVIKITLCKLGFLIHIKRDQARTRAGTFSMWGSPSLLCQGREPSVAMEGCFSLLCKLFAWMKSLLFLHPRLGALLPLDWWQRHLIDNFYNF